MSTRLLTGPFMHTLTHSLSLSCTHCPSHARTHTQPLTVPLIHTHSSPQSLSCTHCPSHAHTLNHSLTVSLMHTMSLSGTHTHALTVPLMHTHTQALSFARPLTAKTSSKYQCACAVGLRCSEDETGAVGLLLYDPM